MPLSFLNELTQAFLLGGYVRDAQFSLEFFILDDIRHKMLGVGFFGSFGELLFLFVFLDKLKLLLFGELDVLGLVLDLLVEGLDHLIQL